MVTCSHLHRDGEKKDNNCREFVSKETKRLKRRIFLYLWLLSHLSPEYFTIIYINIGPRVEEKLTSDCQLWTNRAEEEK